MASVSLGKCCSQRVGERLCPRAYSWVPACPQLTLSQMVVSMPRLPDPGRMCTLWAELPRVVVSYSPEFVWKRDSSRGLTQARAWDARGRLLGHIHAVCPALCAWGVSAGSRTCSGC